MPDTADGRILAPPGMYKALVNNGRNCQPQLVQDFSHQQYLQMLSFHLFPNSCFRYSYSPRFRAKICRKPAPSPPRGEDVLLDVQWCRGKGPTRRILTLLGPQPATVALVLYTPGALRESFFFEGITLPPRIMKVENGRTSNMSFLSFRVIFH